MKEKKYNILFLCTGNSARSVMAEAFMWVAGNGRFNTFSAGSHPTGKVNPFAVEQIDDTGFSHANLRSKSWDEFAGAEGPQMDFIITVCDNAAGEACPYWPGKPSTAHWGFADPAAVEGSDEIKRAAFAKIAAQIRSRIASFAKLPLHSMTAQDIARELKVIGQSTLDA
jgi:arsenate reductase (thioredoxin)